MAQTTGAMTGAAGQIWLKVGAGSYVDISGSSQSIDMPTVTRKTGEGYTPGTDYPLTFSGPREAVEVTVNVMYTEVAGEAFLTAEAAFVANSTVQLKWLPLGAVAGADQFETASEGAISQLDYAIVDGSASGPIICKFIVRSSRITRTANP